MQLLIFLRSEKKTLEFKKKSERHNINEVLKKVRRRETRFSRTFQFYYLNAKISTILNEMK